MIRLALLGSLLVTGGFLLQYAPDTGEELRHRIQGALGIDLDPSQRIFVDDVSEILVNVHVVDSVHLGQGRVVLRREVDDLFLDELGEELKEIAKVHLLSLEGFFDSRVLGLDTIVRRWKTRRRKTGAPVFVPPNRVNVLDDVCLSLSAPALPRVKGDGVEAD